MLREEFMKYAMNETATITSRESNRIMNMVERAWAEGKKNAEIEAITEIAEAAFEKWENQKGCENLTDNNNVDEFFCSNCGIILEDWTMVEIDDDGDRTNHEYIFNFCPNCGSHIKRCKHG